MAVGGLETGVSGGRVDLNSAGAARCMFGLVFGGGFFSVTRFVTVDIPWLEYDSGFPLWGLLAGPVWVV
jgi:hypothetical protein